MSTKTGPKKKPVERPSGSQTLFRGLDVLESVADDPVDLPALAEKLGLSRSTTYRLAAALVERRYLNFAPREGYSLGPKLMQLGYAARQQTDLSRLAARHLELLASHTEETVHLAMMDHRKVLYVDIIPGRRRISISSRIGERQPLTTTGLGKSLILDESEDSWSQHYADETAAHRSEDSYDSWVKRMRKYASLGCSFDIEENEPNVRCVAAPVRNAGNEIVAAISVTGLAQNMSDDRMEGLAEEVKNTAKSISRDLGWVFFADRSTDKKSSPKHGRKSR